MLYDKLKNNKRIPFHMPGHKRNTALLGDKLPYDIDITEIDGFDNLHCVNGILKDIQDKLKAIYGSKKSYALVNGSTVGILAGVCSLVSRGETVLMPRCCHKSVYNAVELAGAKTEFIPNEFDEYGIAKPVSISRLAKAFEKCSPSLVIITSPTYEGVKSDIKAICEFVHKNDVPVLVDAAHGAHFFEEYRYADIVIMSLHKTLPALTQCAVANIYGDLADTAAFEKKLSVFETSSPSYVLLASIDECADFVLDNRAAFSDYYARIEDFYTIRLSKLRMLKYDDPGKLVVFTGYSNISGVDLADKLRRDYNIEIEMASADYVIAMTSVCDSEESFFALKNALTEIDIDCSDSGDDNKALNTVSLPGVPPRVKASDCPVVELSLSECRGKVSAEYIWAYPPGIPIICPGEVFTDEIIEYLVYNSVVNIQSDYGGFPQKIRCKMV